MNPSRFSAALVFALLLLAVLWQSVLIPPQRVPVMLAVALHVAVLIPATVLFLLRRPSATFFAGLAALFLFCHGVMEAWSAPPARLWAGLEIVLATALVFASSWNGLRARLARRRGV